MKGRVWTGREEALMSKELPYVLVDVFSKLAYDFQEIIQILVRATDMEESW